MTDASKVTAKIMRLGPGDEGVARDTFAVMAAVFEEDGESASDATTLDDAYVCLLLGRPDFFALTAIVDDVVVGGVTAHVLPMTRSATKELFLYDLAVREDHQRRGIGRALVLALLALARAEDIEVAFVPADDEDEPALAFYRSLGAEASPVTIFTFSR